MIVMSDFMIQHPREGHVVVSWAAGPQLGSQALTAMTLQNASPAGLPTSASSVRRNISRCWYEVPFFRWVGIQSSSRGSLVLRHTGLDSKLRLEDSRLSIRTDCWTCQKCTHPTLRQSDQSSMLQQGRMPSSQPQCSMSLLHTLRYLSLSSLCLPANLFSLTPAHGMENLQQDSGACYLIHYPRAWFSI